MNPSSVQQQVIINQPMPMAVPVIMTQPTQIVTRNTWNSTICDCANDCGVCCFAFWCFPCFTCSTVNKFGECCCLPILDCPSYVCFAPPAIAISMRASVRERYGIHGSICDDCVIMCCCSVCGWCQIARELNYRQKPLIVTQTVMG